MKIFKIIKYSLFVFLGTSIFFLKDIYLEGIRFFIGSLILIYAADDFVRAILFEEHEAEKMHLIYKGIAQFILGAIMLILIKDPQTVCVIWGVWAILRESEEIKECIELCKERTPFVLNLAESILAIVLSITMIMEPEAWEHHATVHLYLLIVELYTAVIFSEARLLFNKYFRKNKTE